MRRQDFVVWEEKFKPLLDKHDEWERFDKYSNYQKLLKTNYKFIWTVIEGDNGNWYISRGYHFVNRLFYLITENPWNEKTRDYKF